MKDHERLIEIVGDYDFRIIGSFVLGAPSATKKSLEECVSREILEETGITVSVGKEKVSITEYFIESVWTNHYFICEYLNGDSSVNLTSEEIALGMSVHWKSLEEILVKYK